MSLSPATISSALKAPSWAVAANWPLIVAALVEFGIDSPLVQVAAAATIHIETAGTFQPIRERGGDAYLNRMYDTGKAAIRLGNTPEADGDGAIFAGEGYIQLTGKANHAKYGKLLGLDLVANPHADRDPRHAARILAAFFKGEGVATAAEGRNWLKVRIRVNGVNRKTGLPNGLNEFLAAVHALLEVAGV